MEKLRPKLKYLCITKAVLLIVLAAAFFLGGCIREAPPSAESADKSTNESAASLIQIPQEPSESPKADANDSSAPKTPPPEPEELPPPQNSSNATASNASTPPEKILPSPKLLLWSRERKITEGVSSCTILKDGEYWLFYTGRGIELAKSSDGLSFSSIGTIIEAEDSKDRIDMATNPSVFATKDEKYRMIYEGSRMDYNRNDRRLYSAISSDGLVWIAEEGVRFEDEGDGKPGELFTSVPDIIQLDDGRLRMYYTRGITSAIAISADEGITWVKEKNLDLERIAIDPDVVVLDDGTYKLFFTSFDSEFGKGEQYMMSASSIDGIDFVLDEGKRLQPSSGNIMVVDPDIVRLPDGRYRMYYGESSDGAHFDIYSAVSAG
jgi:hypothetical protein